MTQNDSQAGYKAETMMADRLKDVPFSGIRKVLDAVTALKAKNVDVIEWQIGRTDFDTPAHIKQAAADALMKGLVHYAPNLGIPSLRKAIGERTTLDNGVKVDGEKQTIVMAGANEGILVGMLAFVNPGDEVLISDPNWHHYKSIASLVGGVPVIVPTSEKDGFTLNPDEVEKRITAKTKMLCVTSPGNPTGCAQSAESMKELARIAIKHNLVVMADEIYARIWYGSGKTAPSIYSLPGMAERTIIINGFTKTYAMDGWRLGWTVASEENTRAMLKVRQYTTVCVNTFIQHGATVALTADQKPVDDMIAEFAKRRRIMLDGLRSIPGVTVPEPLGAFYVFPNMSSFGMSSMDLADYLIDKHHIATVAGSVFGAAGEGHLRMAYSCSTADCERGIVKLKSALAELKK